MKYTLITTRDYDRWLSTLKNPIAKAALVSRSRRMENGNFGDSHSIREGVSEMRINTGPGYRVYYTIRNLQVVFLLCGGDKSTQKKDIERAIALAKEI
jgi:putative addiction module killer protein